MRPISLATCVALSALPALASNHITGGSGEVQPRGDAPGYVVLRQPQADHVITIYVRPIAGQGGDPANHEWERTEPGGGGYTASRTIEWDATAACGAGINWIRIQGPGGTQTQTFNGSRNAIAGDVAYDSFDPDALDAVCIGWGEAMNVPCANGNQNRCPDMQIFDETHRAIVRGSAPVTVSGQCTDGQMQTNTYRPRLELICRQAN